MIFYQKKKKDQSNLKIGKEKSKNQNLIQIVLLDIKQIWKRKADHIKILLVKIFYKNTLIKSQQLINSYLKPNLSNLPKKLTLNKMFRINNSDRNPSYKATNKIIIYSIWNKKIMN